MNEITLKIDKQKFDLILSGLGKLPAETVYNLITELYNQYQQQIKPAEDNQADGTV